jgi:hypothetical protein
MGRQGEPGLDCVTWHWDTNQSIFCCAGFDTWGAKSSQELIVTRGIGTPIIQSFCCAGFDTWGAKASQDLGTPINQSFCCAGFDTWGAKASQDLNCDTRHWEAIH